MTAIDYLKSDECPNIKHGMNLSELQLYVIAGIMQAYHEKQCAINGVVKSDSELLQAYKKDDIVLLDNKVKVRIIIPEPKVLIDEEKSGCKMWVETKRLVKQSAR